MYSLTLKPDQFQFSLFGRDLIDLRFSNMPLSRCGFFNLFLLPSIFFITCMVSESAHADDTPTPRSIYGKKEVIGPIQAKTGQVIENLHITSTTGACIIIQNHKQDITIRNNEIGPCSKDGKPADGVLSLEQTTHIKVQRNVFHDVSTGAFFYKSLHPIYFDHNYIYNILGPFPQGQMVQFHSVTSGTQGSKILCNISDQQGSAVQHTEDHISMWVSLGLPGDERTEIAYNRLRGGASKSGSGIQSGDGGGGNVWVHDNTIVNVGGGGAGIAGGEHITIENNRIYGDGKTTLSGVGIYVKNYYPKTLCDNNLIRNNRVFTMNSAWFTPPLHEDYGTDNSCTNMQVIDNHWNDTRLNARIFYEKYNQCN